MSRRILVVDDSPLTLEVVKAGLEGAGYEVACAVNLAQLEAERGRGPFDLILMDVQMPEAFGDDVAMVLRSVRGEKTPMYLLSTRSEAELAERAREAGIEGYISKQSGIPTLVEKVRAILGRGSDG
jgi:CheY-like chemotaxis protein